MSEHTDDLEGYRRGLAAGELRGQRCADCDRQWWPPRAVCPHCGSVGEHEWVLLPATARLFTWTVVSRTTLPEFTDRVPYATGVLAFDELEVRVVGFLDADPDLLRVDQVARWHVGPHGPAGEPRVRWTVVD